MSRLEELFKESTHINGTYILITILEFFGVLDSGGLGAKTSLTTYMINKEGLRYGKIEITKGYILITKIEEPF